MEAKEKIMACLHILKRLPPSLIQKNVDSLAALIPDYSEELYSKVDKPLDIATDSQNGQFYIQSEYNRDGDSFRSHHTNTYDPPLEDGITPSERLRSMELKANTLFNEYRHLYYEGGVSSCYFWDKDDGNFATAWMIRKNVDQVKGVKVGSWSSINVIDVKCDESKLKWTYKITTSVVLEMNIDSKQTGDFNVNGSLTKTKDETNIITNQILQNKNNLDAIHLEKIGTLVEDLEGQLRGYLDVIYFGKTRDIVFSTRLPDGEKQFEQQKKQLANELKGLSFKG